MSCTVCVLLIGTIPQRRTRYNCSEALWSHDGALRLVKWPWRCRAAPPDHSWSWGPAATALCGLTDVSHLPPVAPFFFFIIITTISYSPVHAQIRFQGCPLWMVLEGSHWSLPRLTSFWRLSYSIYRCGGIVLSVDSLELNVRFWCNEQWKHFQCFFF